MTIDFRQLRENMVEQQVRPWEVVDMRVLEALNAIPREDFVPESQRANAYADTSLPLGHGEYMMKPVVEGRCLQGLLPQAHERVLEIGTGSGYLTACLARMSSHVTSLEIDEMLAERARTNLSAQGIQNIEVVEADAMNWSSEATFDVVCVTGAVTEVPVHFLKWLAPTGRMFVVRGQSPVMEAIVRHADGRTDSLFETDLPYLKGAAPAPSFKF